MLEQILIKFIWVQFKEYLMFVSLRKKITINGKNVVSLQSSVRLWTISINRFFVLANRAAWFTKGLFYFYNFMGSLNGFMPYSNIA